MIANAVALCMVVGFARQTRAAPERVRPLRVSRVVHDLVAEAQASLDEKQDWPREQSDAADDLKSYRVIPQEVLAALGRTLDRKPAMDGYVKWQLLSFKPDFQKLKEGYTRRIINAMPKIIRQIPPPPPPGSERAGGGGGPGLRVGKQTTIIQGLQPVPGTRLFRPVMGVINTGTFLDDQGYVAIDPNHKKFSAISAVEQFHTEQDAISLANEPTLLYRDRLIEALPRRGGYRLLAMLKDVRDRIKAGDPSAGEAVDRVMEESKTLTQDLGISRATYRQLLASTKLLMREKTKILDDMTVTDDGGNDLKVIEIYFPRSRQRMLEMRVKAYEKFLKGP